MPTRPRFFAEIGAMFFDTDRPRIALSIGATADCRLGSPLKPASNPKIPCLTSRKPIDPSRIRSRKLRESDSRVRPRSDPISPATIRPKPVVLARSWMMKLRRHRRTPGPVGPRGADRPGPRPFRREPRSPKPNGAGPDHRRPARLHRLDAEGVVGREQRQALEARASDEEFLRRAYLDVLGPDPQRPPRRATFLRASDVEQGRTASGPSSSNTCSATPTTPRTSRPSGR